jgi:hypothetical protein
LNTPAVDEYEGRIFYNVKKDGLDSLVARNARFVYSIERKSVPPRTIEEYWEIETKLQNFCDSLKAAKGLNEAVFCWGHEDRTISVEFYDAKMICPEVCSELSKFLATNFSLWRIHLATFDAQKSTIIYPNKVVIPSKWKDDPNQYWKLIGSEQTQKREESIEYFEKLQLEWAKRSIRDFPNQQLFKVGSPRVIGGFSHNVTISGEPITRINLWVLTNNEQTGFLIDDNECLSIHFPLYGNGGPQFEGCGESFGITEKLEIKKHSFEFDKNGAFIARLYVFCYSLKSGQTLNRDELMYNDPTKDVDTKLMMDPSVNVMTSQELRSLLKTNK